ncbi:MAG TPA: heme-binding protein [Gemmataceae bacterium]|nr:heme-binding protein [Gemmataceae bacterium]
MGRIGWIALTMAVLTGALGFAADPKKKGVAAPAETLQTLPGFKVELIHTSDAATEGSWINMTADDKGRLIISGQNKQPILRVTIKDGQVDQMEKLDLPISEAMGLLYAFDSLYIDGAGPKGYGLYRCKDTKGTGQFDEVKLLKKFTGGGEHGAHAVVLGPDNNLYVIEGNFCDVPEGMAPDSPHRNYQEDLLLPRQPDGNGFAAGRYAPGGFVLRTDPDGKKWDLMLGGFRNAYDFAFNADGELFTFDADMEWDWGFPWYRPIRINHCISGADFGWRNGAGKWPEYYPDSFGAVVNVGVGSPTGVVFGTGAKFPAKYQKAFYMCDWSYGRLIAAHLTPKGASYTAEFENFVAPKSLKGDGPKTPLPLTDVVIGSDGALYFTTGGRGTQSGLYRVSYTGNESTSPADLHDAAGAKERELRHALEAFHGKHNPVALDAAWPHLNSDDRALRYAARIAVESQPVADWKGRALAEKQPEAALTALLALARSGDKTVQPDLLAALSSMPLGGLSEDQQLEELRVMQLAFIRQGPPPAEAARKVAAELDAEFPTKSEKVNHEIAQILIYLRAPHIAEKCLRLAAEAKTQEDELFYVYVLRTLPIGNWTMEQRKEYFSYFTKDHKRPGHPAQLLQWFADAGRPYGDGASFPNYMKHIFAEATANLSDAERKELAPLLASIDQASVVNYVSTDRPAIKAYKTAEILPMLDRLDHGRSYDKGRQAYLDCQCIKCHRFGQEGGAVGPDLTAVSSRFAAKDILESIIEPSKVVSEQYLNIIVTTKSDKTIVGRLVEDTPRQLIVQPNPLEPERVIIPKSDVDTVEPSKVSPMPEHLVDGLTGDEILDLIAYLQSQGRKDYRAFQK